MRVKIQYFKGSGKYYSEGGYVTAQTSIGEIFAEVRAMFVQGDCPGLTFDAFHRNSFAAYIEVPEHPHNHPYLIVADGYGVEE